jgi:hypothetical protein
VSINTTTGTPNDNASAVVSCVDAMYKRLRQIELERVKALNDVYNLSISQDLDIPKRLFDGSRRSNATRSAPIQSDKRFF